MHNKRLNTSILGIALGFVIVSTNVGLVFAESDVLERRGGGLIWGDEGYVKTPLYEEGNGSKESPYLIRTAEQLYKLEEIVNHWFIDTEGVHFRLESDISLKGLDTFDDDGSGIGHGNWEGIGHIINPFKGVFDGNNKVISDIELSTSPHLSGVLGVKEAGLFGIVEDAKIHNLKLQNVTLSNNNGEGRHVGALVGRSMGDVALNNIKVQSNLNVTKAPSVGGLVGLSQGNLKLTNCHVTTKLNAVYGNVGGLVGYSKGDYNLDITNSSANMNIKSVKATGGLVGKSDGTLKINKSKAIGELKVIELAGGLVGIGNNVEIKDSIFKGKVLEHKMEGLQGGTVGGIIGNIGKTCKLYKTTVGADIQGNFKNKYAVAYAKEGVLLEIENK